MPILTQAQATFVLEQIEAAVESNLDIDRLTWRIAVRHPSRPLMTWLHIEWEGHLDDRNYGAVSISNPDGVSPAEHHASTKAMRSAYRI